MVGLKKKKNGHIRKVSLKMVNPRDLSEDEESGRLVLDSRFSLFQVESYQYLKIGGPLASGVLGSALELVGPLSVYFDWVKEKVGSAILS